MGTAVGVAVGLALWRMTEVEGPTMTELAVAVATTALLDSCRLVETLGLSLRAARKTS